LAGEDHVAEGILARGGAVGVGVSQEAAVAYPDAAGGSRRGNSRSGSRRPPRDTRRILSPGWRRGRDRGPRRRRTEGKRIQAAWWRRRRAGRRAAGGGLGGMRFCLWPMTAAAAGRSPPECRWW
jgi:hypothetical protein